MTLETSRQWTLRAQKVTPGGVHSPVRSFKHVGGHPVYFTRGEGARLFDVDGNSYIDFCASFGPHLLGHSHPVVVKVLRDQALLATSFGACHPGEVELAEKVLRAYPYLDKVRFVNSGTEAVMTAVRIARGVTRKQKIIRFNGCYHGHSDMLLAQGGSGLVSLSEASSKGVPPSAVEDTLVARLDSIESVRNLFQRFEGDIAAVLLEPIPANYGLYIPPRETLLELMELASRHKALIIFDEVISGFRIGLTGASGYFDITADLVTLGKVIGGGLPLAAVVGRSELMDALAPIGEVYQAGTLSSNPLAVAAGNAVLDEIFRTPPFEELSGLTQEFSKSLERILRGVFERVRVRSVGSLFWISFEESGTCFPPQVGQESLDSYSRLFQGALRHGLYLAPSPYEVGFISLSHHAEIISEALERFERVKIEISKR